ncbi:MAG TPA: hypothetical protein VFK97_02450, partial [Candidatus Saccharimonadales bacterium]|nr:hypothetical protein [Candidatus Saccharimonadales bacterium]
LAIFVGIIIFIVLLVMIFGGHGKKAPVGPQLKPLPDYAASDATVSFTTDGIVNADELHRSVRITVSSSQMTLDILKGYNPQVIQSKSFENNQEAYTIFLKAIDNAGFLAKIKNSKAPADEGGLCPLGFRYILDLNQDGDDLSRTWASTCGSKIGTSAGALQTLQTLFQEQIPGYQTLVQNVNLSANAEVTGQL